MFHALCHGCIYISMQQNIDLFNGGFYVFSTLPNCDFDAGLTIDSKGRRCHSSLLMAERIKKGNKLRVHGMEDIRYK